MNKEFVMRGQTGDFKTTGDTELLEFGGRKPGYGYKLTEFKLYPSTAIGTAHHELCGSITAGKTVADPENPNFNDEGLIATTIRAGSGSSGNPNTTNTTVVNDTFLITQNLILSVTETIAAAPINWQCRFEAVKLNSSQEAVANYKQFNIFDE